MLNTMHFNLFVLRERSAAKMLKTPDKREKNMKIQREIGRKSRTDEGRGIKKDEIGNERKIEAHKQIERA